MERKEELQLRAQLCNERMMKCQAQGKLVDMEFSKTMQELQGINRELKELNQKPEVVDESVTVE